MTVLKILIFPDPRLRTISKPILVVDEKIKKLASDLLETMYEGKGIGLSATQVNIHKRILVVDISEDKKSPLVLINPKVEVLGSKKSINEEGCLSVPGFYEEVERPSKIKVTALDINKKKLTFSSDGLLAVAIQHEMDHLEGKIFVDFLSNLKRLRIRKKILKQLKGSS